MISLNADGCSDLFLSLIFLVLVFCNKMLQQLEDFSYVKPSEVVRQTYESISAPIVESWMENEVFYLFGKKYQLPDDREEFLKIIKSKIWCTYRKGFCAIGGNGPTSDSGWGCMLRSGQMMLAEALTRLNLGNDWRYDETRPIEHDRAYWKLLMEIVDRRSSRYSIQQIAQMGVGEGKEVGEWFGPNTISQVLKKLSHFDVNNDLSIHVAMQNVVVIADVEEQCCVKDDVTTEAASPSWKPLLLLIPLRLGLDELNPVYLAHLKECMNYPSSVGFVGGKPNQAYYFVGHSDDSLVFLDPHTTQQTVKLPECGSSCFCFDDSTYHCESPRRMQISKLDPSLALGFFFPTRRSFESFCERINSYETSRERERIISTIASIPDEWKCQTTTSSSSHRRRRRDVDDVIEAASDSGTSEESFEILDDDFI